MGDGLSRRSTFILVTLIVALSTLAAVAYTLLRLRAETIERHFETATIHARAFEDHLTHSFNVIDLTLASVAAETQVPNLFTSALLHAPYLRSLARLGPDDRIAASSNAQNRGVKIERRDFKPPLAAPQQILRTGPPWIGRDFGAGHPALPAAPAAPDAPTLITVMRDVATPQGQWATLVAAVNTDYFLNYYSRNLAEHLGSVDLLRHDGMLLLSTDSARRPGSIDASPAFLKRIAGADLGQLEEALPDGRTTLTAFRASQRFPFVLAVRLDKAQVLDEWRQESMRTGLSVLAVLVIGLAIAALYFVRLEHAARRHDADLEQLRLRGAALEAAANAIIITNRDGAVEWANPAFCQMSGYSMAETLGQNPRTIVRSGAHTPDEYRQLWRTILAGDVWRGELINRRKDGSLYPEDQTITPVRDADGVVRHFVAVKQDITERRLSEIRMAELSRHLVVVQESARRRLSGELHDRTSPNLAAIGVNLDIIGAMLHADEASELAARFDDVRALIADTTASIREICADLRPPVLDYGGLVAALESYTHQFQRRTGIVTRYSCSNRDARMPAADESALFRIAQEALTNCAKHSRATQIDVDLVAGNEHLRLTLADNGIGFKPDALGDATYTCGLGILTMREMAEFSGGSFMLASAPGSGTRITVEILRKES